MTSIGKCIRGREYYAIDWYFHYQTLERNTFVHISFHWKSLLKTRLTIFQGSWPISEQVTDVLLSLSLWEQLYGVARMEKFMIWLITKRAFFLTVHSHDEENVYNFKSHSQPLHNSHFDSVAFLQYSFQRGGKKRISCISTYCISVYLHFWIKIIIRNLLLCTIYLCTT